MTERTGRCLCGAVTYQLTGEPLVVRVCWCSDCQRLAANGTVNAVVPNEALQIQGTLSEYKSKAQSGNDLIRRFCHSVELMFSGSHLHVHSSPLYEWAH